MNKTATVSQVGKFFKVITNTGEDISNQIERPMRKKALELGKELEYDTKNSCWKISGVQSTSTPVPMKKAPNTKKVAIEKLEDELVAQTKVKRERKQYDSAEMPMPKYVPGDLVTVDFIGSKRKVVLSELKRNPQNINRWVYSGTEVNTGINITYIGVDGSEQFANIIEDITE